jgi:integrase
MILNTKPPKPYRKPNGKYVAQVRKPDGRRTKITLVDDLALSQRIIADAYRAFDAVKSGAAVSIDDMSDHAVRVLRVLVGPAHPIAARVDARTPLNGHVDAYVAHLRASGRTKRYVDGASNLIRQIAAHCRWATLADVEHGADTFERFIHSLAMRQVNRNGETRPISNRRINEHIGAVRAFIRWCMVTPSHAPRLSADPLRFIKPRPVHQVEERAVFTFAQFEALLDATKPRSLQRYTLYGLMGLSGIRPSEARRLRWCDFDRERGYLAVWSKTQRHNDLCLNDDALDILAAWREARGPVKPTDPVFGLCWTDLAHQFDADLVAASIDKLDGQGRSRSPYSLRHSFGCWLYERGVGVADVQRAMRHSSPTMTERYLRGVGVLLRDDQARRLPRLMGQANVTEGAG